MNEQKRLTVRELIKALQSLPEEDQDRTVGAYAEGGCVSADVYGVEPEPSRNGRIMLDSY